MKKTTHGFIAAAVAAAGALLFAGSATALDVRSWDQRIDDATKRYVVLAAFNNQAVLDKETQLLWQRQAMGAMSWFNAMNNCLQSNAALRSGWRLPSFSELSSLLGTGARLPSGHPFTGLPSNGFFWSATADSDASRAYSRQMVYLDPVYVYRAPKTNSAYVMCVRGPGAEGGY